MTAPCALTEALLRESGLFSALEELLRAEHVALANADLPALEAILPRKATLIDALSECAAVRLQTLRDAGSTPDREGAESWVAQIGGEAATAWPRLLACAARCQAQHAANAVLLEALAGHNRQAIQALRGIGGSGLTYGADGKPTSVAVDPRDLGLA